MRASGSIAAARGLVRAVLGFELGSCGVDLGRRSVRRGAGFVEGLAPLHREAVDAAATPEAGRSELGGWSAFMVA